MGERIGIIAGSGYFPYLVAKELQKKGKKLFVLAVEPEATALLSPLAEAISFFPPGAAAAMLRFLKDNGISEVVMVGKINPGWLLEEKNLDALAQELLSLSPEKTAPSLVDLAIRFLHLQGIEVVDPAPFFQPYFCSPGYLTRHIPPADVLNDATLAFRLACVLAELEIGQVVAVKKGIVAAVEAMEGTDKMITRAAELAGANFSLAKVGRFRQKMTADVPGIGLKTIQALVSGQAACLVIEAGAVAFFDQEEALPLAEEAGLAILVKKRDNNYEGDNG